MREHNIEHWWCGAERNEENVNLLEGKLLFLIYAGKTLYDAAEENVDESFPTYYVIRSC